MREYNIHSPKLSRRILQVVQLKYAGDIRFNLDLPDGYNPK